MSPGFRRQANNSWRPFYTLSLISFMSIHTSIYIYFLFFISIAIYLCTAFNCSLTSAGDKRYQGWKLTALSYSHWKILHSVLFCFFKRKCRDILCQILFYFFRYTFYIQDKLIYFRPIGYKCLWIFAVLYLIYTITSISVILIL